MTETRWLTASEQDQWRGLVRGSSRLFEQLDRELRAEHAITLDEYGILVQLSEGAAEGLRMSVLATHTLMSKSRLTYTVDRMERAGLIERLSCPEDGRGLRAALTEQGWDLIRTAAHTHVQGVRRWLVDVLTPEEFAAIGTGLDRVREHIESQPRGEGCTGGEGAEMGCPSAADEPATSAAPD
jgi:DNA-binding MarR family transcriptional regulator